jgi:hypothetical protein
LKTKGIFDMNAIEILAAATYAACFRDLPDIEYESLDLIAERKYLDGLSENERVRYYVLRGEIRESTLKQRADFFESLGIPLHSTTRRPQPDDCVVDMFMQTWPNTAQGYDASGGMVGQAFIDAYTVIVQCHYTAAVYFGGDRLAYLVNLRENSKSSKKIKAWDNALGIRQLPGQKDAAQYEWYPVVSRVA